MSLPLGNVDPDRRSGQDGGVYVAGLVIVAAIVNWLVDVLGAAVIARYVVPSLQRARRERGEEFAGRRYSRGVAAARFLRYLADALAVFATCYYYAQNNAPGWPAWAVFGAFFAFVQAPRLLGSGAEMAGFRRSAA